MLIQKRMRNILILIFLFILILFLRLMELQLISTESFSGRNINLIEESVRQRTQEVVLDQGRGGFIDRNNEPLTHDISPSLVLFPFLQHMDWPVEKVASIVNVPAEQLVESLKESNKPVVFGGEKTPYYLTKEQMERINSLEIPGLFAVNRQYKLDGSIAGHLIGITGENEKLVNERYPNNENLTNRTVLGITGLQKSFDEFLLPEGETKLMYHVDAIGRPLFGIDVKYTSPANPYYPVEIKTTLDKQIQLAAEDIVKESGLRKGGLVLLDIENNEVLAMVSAPQLNHSNPYSDNSAQNQMLQSHIPGSVWKIIIAAAAIEHNTYTQYDTFNCKLNLYGELDEKHDHGELSFEESFAKSCNFTFATLAAELIKQDATIIEEYAKKLGVIDPVGWHNDVFHFNDFKQFSGESSGEIWGTDADKRVSKAIAQTAIGQKDVRVTPLAIANMMSTIAKGGKKEQVKAVSDIRYKNGTNLFQFKDQQLDGDSISPYTAMKLQQLLRLVVTEGTGQRFADLPYEVAGKSGTAEIGRKNAEGEYLVNKWFAGYFPVKTPKYALVVVDLEQVSSRSVTNTIFYDLVNKLYEYDTGS